jgi:putative transposase
VQRGFCRAACFFCDDDRIAYLEWLARDSTRLRCAVHAYALMGNHVHLLLTPSTGWGVRMLVQKLVDRHARRVRSVYARPSPLQQGHMDVSPVYLRRYVLACMRYIERNPVHAGLAESPGGYRWSSYGANALGSDDPVVTPHPFYYALGRTPLERRTVWRAFVSASPPSPARHATPAPGRAPR